jgi:hypothetical protein
MPKPQGGKSLYPSRDLRLPPYSFYSELYSSPLTFIAFPPAGAG